MRSFRAYITAFIIVLATGSAVGQKVYTVDAVPDVHRLDGRRYVSDPEGILKPETVSTLDGIAARLDALAGVEIAVVVVPSIGGDTPEDFTVRLFEKWGIGKKGEDTGLLILLATGDRIVRFEVGYGLEGVLTDALSKRIQTQRMNPYLRSGGWDGGLIAGLTAVDELFTDPSSELRAEAQAEEDWTGSILVLVFFVLMIIIAISISRKERKCPRCGAMMKPLSSSSRTVAPGRRIISTVYRCPKCGYTTTKNRTQDIGGAVAGGTIAGGLGGMGRGGAGGFGGGWGGGRSGGGGATTRF